DISLNGFLSLVHRDDRESVRQSLIASLKSGEPLASDCRIRFADGSERILNIQAKVMRDASGQAIRMHGTIQDITERKDAEQRIRYLAYYDSLTDLPNRAMFREQLDRALTHARKNSQYAAVLFLDVDHFKLINDTLGHSVGDLLLQAVAKRIAACVREQDAVARPGTEELNHSVARLGGDEFTILLANIGEAHDAGRVARRLL